jgi:hypothetical protein
VLVTTVLPTTTALQAATTSFPYRNQSLTSSARGGDRSRRRRPDSTRDPTPMAKRCRGGSSTITSSSGITRTPRRAPISCCPRASLRSIPGKERIAAVERVMALQNKSPTAVRQTHALQTSRGHGVRAGGLRGGTAPTSPCRREPRIREHKIGKADTGGNSQISAPPRPIAAQTAAMTGGGMDGLTLAAHQH